MQHELLNNISRPTTRSSRSNRLKALAFSGKCIQFSMSKMQGQHRSSQYRHQCARDRHDQHLCGSDPAEGSAMVKKLKAQETHQITGADTRINRVQWYQRFYRLAPSALQCRPAQILPILAWFFQTTIPSPTRSMCELGRQAPHGPRHAIDTNGRLWPPAFRF